jgi:hypothetical protein
MSTFEFVLVALSIIIGFGVSEILADWGEQIRARKRLPPFYLHINATALLLYLHLGFLWAGWSNRGIKWTFPQYLLVAAPPCVLGLCAHIMKLDTTPGAPSPREQYFGNSRPAYTVLALFPLLVIAISLTPGTNLGGAPFTLLRIVGIGLLLSLAWSKTEKYHWIALGILWLVSIGAVIRLAFRLVEDAV